MFKVASINQGGASREMIYGYARVSTANQRLDRQVRSIEQWAGERRIEKIYREKYTGTTIDRPQFSRLLSIIKSGDTIVFDSVSRMSRTAMEGFELYMALLNKGVDRGCGRFLGPELSNSKTASILHRTQTHSTIQCLDHPVPVPGKKV